MSARETVITHLQIIHTWAEFARERDLQFFTVKHLEDIAQWADDAITMLKEQEQDRIEIAHEMISNSILMYQGKEIVRCKDCDNRECDGRAGTIVCGITGESHSRLWFCADGERRNDNA